MADTEDGFTYFDLLLYAGIIITIVGGAVWSSSSGLFVESYYLEGQILGGIVLAAGLVTLVLSFVAKGQLASKKIGG